MSDIENAREKAEKKKRAETDKKIIARAAHLNIGPGIGTCCACDYNGSEDTDCPKMKDGVHCNHWHDGEDAK